MSYGSPENIALCLCNVNVAAPNIRREAWVGLATRQASESMLRLPFMWAKGWVTRRPFSTGHQAGLLIKAKWPTDLPYCPSPEAYHTVT